MGKAKANAPAISASAEAQLNDEPLVETPSTQSALPAGAETGTPDVPTPTSETAHTNSNDIPAPIERIIFTLTGAGSFTGVSLGRIPKGGRVEVDEDTAAVLRRTGLFEEE